MYQHIVIYHIAQSIEYGFIYGETLAIGRYDDGRIIRD